MCEYELARMCVILGPMKEKTIRRLTVELDADLWKRISHLAVDEQKSLKELIVDALEALLAQKKKEK